MVCAGSSGHTTCNVSNNIVVDDDDDGDDDDDELFQGDSGGPMVCPDEAGVGKLAGLVSFGHSGCTSAGVFTKVAFYQDWIQARLQP